MKVLRIVLILIAALLVQSCVKNKNIAQEKVKGLQSIKLVVEAAPKSYKNTSKNKEDWWYATGGFTGALMAELSVFGNEKINSKLNQYPIDIVKISDVALRKKVQETPEVKWNFVEDNHNFVLKFVILEYGVLPIGMKDELKPHIMFQATIFDKEGKELWVNTDFISAFNEDSNSIFVSTMSQNSVESSYVSALNYLSGLVVQSAL